MQIKWTRTAANDLNEIEEYISKENPIAAIEQILKILNQVEELLSVHPEIGRNGRVKNTQELVIVETKFIAIYRIEENNIYILRILHGAQLWPIKKD